MQRVRVVGVSGSGKTTTAAVIARRLGLPHRELDGLHWMPGWQPRAPEEFRRLVEEFARQPAWVMDGNYAGRLADLLDDRVDTWVWLDLPRWRVMAALLRRTLRRSVRRQELWGTGNRERLSSLLDRDPLENLLLWAWTRHAPLRQRYAEAQCAGGQHWVRLRSRADVRRFLAGLPADAARADRRG